MPHEGSLLQATLVLLLAAVCVVPLAKRLQLGAVLGYLIAGVVIGPAALQLIHKPENVAHFSEFGVVLLLFIIGLELSPRRLWLMRKSVFGVGLAQVALSGLVIGGVAYLGFSQPWQVSVVLGLGLALSSTAFGLQILAERKQLNSSHGRLAFAILLFQDIAAIPLIALVPLLSGGMGVDDAATPSVLRILATIAAVIVGGRYLLRPVFRMVAKTGLQEVSTATALLVVLGTAWLMDAVGVSMALGAFLAGLLLADSEYRHELESQIEPFKGLLLGLFFISVGMSADVKLLVTMPLAVLGLTALLMVIKLPILALVGSALGGLDRRSALKLGIVLAAGGEFAFVIFQIAKDQQLLNTELHSTLILAITLSMAVTPLLIILLSKLLKPLPVATKAVPPEYEDIESHEPRVVIIGMGRMGQIVARILRAQRVPFVALDLSVDTIELSRSIDSMSVFYGDPLRPEILRAVDADKAEYFVLTADDPETNIKITELVSRLYPHIKFIARARSRFHVHRLLELGAKPIRETFHSSLEISRETLMGLGLSPERAEARIQRFQRHDEELLAEQHAVFNDREALIQSARDAHDELQALFDADVIEEKGV
ncbi:monovalent cation:proton antiporter-2 (CPA2) family protein [Zhongshania arctica]|uniref:Monovalent cation:proton antiporter-2 (CPA2) family protein n=1 Tax=Zhongshania arctica TaxID=3238302 RepID=A0ABV3TSN3_9GAMM